MVSTYSFLYLEAVRQHKVIVYGLLGLYILLCIYFQVIVLDSSSSIIICSQDDEKSASQLTAITPKKNNAGDCSLDDILSDIECHRTPPTKIKKVRYYYYYNFYTSVFMKLKDTTQVDHSF